MSARFSVVRVPLVQDREGFVDVPWQHSARAENEKIHEGKVPEDWSEKKRSHKDTKPVVACPVTDAALHGSQRIAPLPDAGRDTTVWAESACRSEKISGELEEPGIANQIHESGYCNHPLTGFQKKSNREKREKREVREVRARVERVSGLQKIMRGARLRTIGPERAERGIGLVNVVCNLFRFAQPGCSMI